MSRGGNNWKGTGTVEATRSLDVMKLARDGFLSRPCSGTIQWSSSDGSKTSIRLKGDTHEVTLDYRVRSNGEDWLQVEQRVPIQWTRCRFGGERPWFVCRVFANGVYCGRRVAKIYGGGKLFACRHCYRLGYQVQRGGPMDQAHHRLRRLHRKLGADYDGPEGIRPPRPKWMRQRTYERLLQQIEAGEEHLDVVFTEGAMRILARAGRMEQHGGNGR